MREGVAASAPGSSQTGAVELCRIDGLLAGMIVANGFPKSGCHALVKSLQLLGVPATVEHYPYGELPAGTTKHVLIKRDPRNVVVAMLRFEYQPVTPGTFLAKFRRFFALPLIGEMARYEPHLATAYVVRYEDLIATDAAMRKMADFCETPYIEGAFAELPGYTYTWHDVHSDYRPLFTPQVQQAWRDEGGDELLERWGY